MADNRAWMGRGYGDSRGADSFIDTGAVGVNTDVARWVYGGGVSCCCCCWDVGGSGFTCPTNSVSTGRGNVNREKGVGDGAHGGRVDGFDLLDVGESMEQLMEGGTVAEWVLLGAPGDCLAQGIAWGHHC